MVIHGKRGVIHDFMLSGIMSIASNLVRFGVEPFSDLKEVAEQYRVCIEIIIDFLVSMEDCAVVSTSELLPNLGPRAL